MSLYINGNKIVKLFCSTGEINSLYTNGGKIFEKQSSKQKIYDATIETSTARLTYTDLKNYNASDSVLIVNGVISLNNAASYLPVDLAKKFVMDKSGNVYYLTDSSLSAIKLNADTASRGETYTESDTKVYESGTYVFSYDNGIVGKYYE